MAFKPYKPPNAKKVALKNFLSNPSGHSAKALNSAHGMTHHDPKMDEIGKKLDAIRGAVKEHRAGKCTCDHEGGKCNEECTACKTGSCPKCSHIEEEGILNSVGSGAIAGAGVNLAGQASNWGEPGVDPYYQYKKRNAETQVSHYNNPIMGPIARRKDPNNNA